MIAPNDADVCASKPPEDKNRAQSLKPFPARQTLRVLHSESPLTLYRGSEASNEPAS
jgi:hypothetical protein